MSRQVYLPLASPASTDGPRCGVLRGCPHLFVQDGGYALCCAFDEQLRVTTGRRSGGQLVERCEQCRTAERLFGEPGVIEPATAAELMDYENGNARLVVDEWLAEQAGPRGDAEVES